VSTPRKISSKTRVHGIAGALALGLISTFMVSTIAVELLGDHADILALKRLIAYGLALVVPCMGLAGGTGFSLSRRRGGRIVEGKKRRMRFVAMNGLLLLVPSALILYQLARAGRFGPLFFTVQGIELVAGAINIFLLSRMMRDGFRLTGRFASRGAKVSAASPSGTPPRARESHP
jgi:hypothetical protein